MDATAEQLLPPATGKASAGYDSMATRQRHAQNDAIVLLTGGSGRTGRIIARRLASRGFRLRILTRNAERATAALDGAGVAPAAYEIVVGDVTSRDDLRRALAPDAATGARVHHVVYAAGGENVDSALVNFQGVDNAARAARAAGLAGRFVLVSAAWTTRPYAIASVLFNTIIRNYPMAQHLKGEDALRRSGLDYAIVKAGAIADDAKGGAKAVRIGQGDTFGFYEGGVPGVGPAALASVCVGALLDAPARATFEVIGARARDREPACTGDAFDWSGAGGQTALAALRPDPCPFAERAVDPVAWHRRALRRVWAGVALGLAAVAAAITLAVLHGEGKV